MNDHSRAHGQSSSAPEARSSTQLLLDPTFGTYFIGKLISTTGVWIYNIAAAILAFELSSSALVVGLVSVAQFGPQLILAPLSGAIADRRDRRVQIVVGRLIVAFGSGALAVWIWLVGVEGLPGAWPVVAVAFVVGLGFVLVAPAQNALIPALVAPTELAQAITLNAVPPTIARAAGPALGAFIAISVGPAVAFAIASATALLFALALIPLNIRTRADGAQGTDGRVLTGLRYLRLDRGIIFLLIGVAAISVGADPVITLAPALSAHLVSNASLVGAFASAFGIGAGLAFAILPWIRPRLGMSRTATTGLGLIAFGIAAAGSSSIPGLVFASLVVAGCGMSIALIALSTILQERLPDAVRGRIMALWSMAFLGSRSIAALINGTVADATTPQVGFLVAALLVAGAAWLCRPAALAAHPPPNVA